MILLFFFFKQKTAYELLIIDWSSDVCSSDLFCGLSMGGMTGMWLGVHAPSRFSHLVLCNTAARIGTPEVWNGRIAAVRQGGMGGIVQGVIQRWFTEGFVTAEPAAVEKISAMLLATAPEGYCGACEAVRDMDQIGRAHV